MIKRPSIDIDTASGWRTPVMFLMIIVAANGLTFATWGALLNNFAVNEVNFTGREIGILQSLREVPGLLAFTAIGFLYIFREQTFAIVSLFILGLGTALTGFFPFEYGFYATTILMSFGFHYYETMNQSLSLQWLPKATAPKIMGKILAVGSISTLSAFAMIFITWSWLKLDFKTIYLIAGGTCMLVAVCLWILFPHFRGKTPQHKTIVLRSRYWLYYALTFMAGARRQIFVVFAGFLMVEKFGFTVAQVTGMFLANALFNIYFAPKIGALIVKWGERRAISIEYIGLIGVFLTYAFVENPWIAAALYIIDHAFFAMAIAMKTYFQKISAPADLAPTAGIAFSINHIAAVFLPVIFGFIWLHNHAAVFIIGAGMAFISLCLSLLIPNDPREGNETILTGNTATQAQPAE